MSFWKTLRKNEKSFGFDKNGSKLCKMDGTMNLKEKGLKNEVEFEKESIFDNLHIKSFVIRCYNEFEERRLEE